ncbi:MULTISPECIES: Mu-like prophage major head subunit gpT family protein [unclassified Sagittula]|jgi:phage major head subunit gpT-like protein|uniref:Mu-like prophage major head subunit gpT family protein n=1 Tax=unclassified Sagittula TaxID=2624628 RepID=UPI0024C21A46|nr:Mu-like prophage major head subunit gpT family protein [Sagittula sp. MA-2]WHZ33414.1 Mu-like prophage major head subunit gpT family protein [Sagittula sp. MA-2]
MTANKGLSSRAIIGRFYQRLEAAMAASWASSIAMTFTTDQESETYKWLGQSPTMSEWKGDRLFHGLREAGITIANIHWANGIEVPTDWVRRDKTGQIMTRVGELAGRAVTHKQSLLSSTLIAAESAVCYDGQYFFDTDHVEGKSGTQSNDITVDISAVPAAVHGTTAAPSPEEVRAMVLAGVEKILGFKDDQGEPLNEMARRFLVMVPTTYFSSAAAALKNAVLGGGDTNVMASLDGYTFELAANPRLTWTDKLVVMRIDGDVKPFIWQQETDLMLDVIAEGSEEEVKNKRWLFGTNYHANAGYGYWQHACLVQAV